jgi:AcrR family transcriptional regulator
VAIEHAGRGGRGPRGEYRKTAERKRAIVDAATTVFSQRGYHGGSLREISREIGVSLAGIVHHFSTKSELLEEVLAVADQRATASLADADEAGTPFATWVVQLVRANMERPEMLRMLAIVSAEASDPNHPAHAWIVHRYDSGAEVFAARIARDQAAGLITAEGTPEQLARTLIAIWDGLQLQWLLDENIDLMGLTKLAVTNALSPAVPVDGA